MSMAGDTSPASVLSSRQVLLYPPPPAFIGKQTSRE